MQIFFLRDKYAKNFFWQYVLITKLIWNLKINTKIYSRSSLKLAQNTHQVHGNILMPKIYSTYFSLCTMDNSSKRNYCFYLFQNVIMQFFQKAKSEKYEKPIVILRWLVYNIQSDRIRKIKTGHYSEGFMLHE